MLTLPDRFATTALSLYLCLLSDNTLAQRTETSTYNDAGQVLSIDGPRIDLSDVTRFDYDLQGNRTRLTNALGQQWLYSRHDPAGNLLESIDPNGVVTTYDYDPRQRLTSMTEAAGTAMAATTTFAYDPTGQLIETIAPNGARTQYEYDAAGRLIALEDDLGNRMEYTLDAADNITGQDILDSSGILVATQTHTYDVLGRMTRYQGADPQITREFAYDGNNNLTEVKDSAGNPTGNRYGPLNNLIEQTDRAGNPVQFEYDAENRLVAVTDQRELTTTYTYNAYGDLIEQQSPDTGLTQYLYDEAGNRISETRSDGTQTDYAYDALNRLTGIDYGFNNDLGVRFDYDQGAYGMGRLTGFADASGNTQYHYDARGRVVEKISSIDGRAFTERYEYDLAGNITTRIYPSGLEVRYERDPQGRVTEAALVNTPAGENQTLAENIGYLPFGPLPQLTYDNGLTLTRDYDQDYRLMQQELLGGTVYEGASYGYDGNANILEILDLDSPIQDQDFGYDELDRLTLDASDYGTKTYEYDAVSNRTRRVFDKPDGRVRDMDFDYAPDSNRLRFVGRRTLAHDDNGNLLEIIRPNGRAKKTWAYDERNRMVAYWKQGVLKATYDYNALGQRVRKTRHRLNQQGTRTEARTHIFHYNQAGQLIQQTVYKPNGTLKRQKHYIWLEQMPIAFLETVYRNNGNIKREELAYITPDHLNTPRIATNNAQQITWTWRSDAFGVGKIEKDPDGDGVKTNIRLRFPGQYEDGESGLHYNYFRDYHPGWGKYVQSDPIGLQGGINTYAYVGGNPINLIDMLGLQGQMSRHKDRQPGRPGRAGIFGCIGGCVSYLQGDKNAQASISPTIGGGLLACGPPKSTNQKTNQCSVDNSNMYDPNEDNAVNFSPSAGYKGVGLGLVSNEDGSTCVAVGLFLGLPIPASVSLGDLNE